MNFPPPPSDREPGGPESALPEARDPALDAALRAEDLYPTPLGLEQRILAALVPEVLAPDVPALDPAGARPDRAPRARPIIQGPWRTPWRVMARIAAAVLVAIGSWFAFSAETPALASARQAPGLLARAQEIVPTDVLPTEIAARSAPAVAAAHDYAPAMLTLVIGVIVLASGLALLLHWHRTAAQGDPS